MKKCGIPVEFILLIVLALQGFSVQAFPDGEKKAARMVYSVDSALNAFLPQNVVCGKGISDTLMYPDEVYRVRIENLSGSMMIPLVYNEHVKKYIDAYSLQNKTKLNRIAALSKYYFPLFEEYLSKYNLPVELKYLAAVESALDANAISVSGATGLWQFIKPTADLMGLRVTSFIDERRDPFLATDAACRYLEYLYRTFGDWHLALAAYNGGPGAVKKAIIRAGGNTDYWQIRPYMTTQMQNYVPAFIAMCYLMNYTREHLIVEAGQNPPYYEVDTLHVSGPLNLVSLAAELDYPIEDIRFLNPVFFRNYIPDDGYTYSLVLPHSKATAFLVKQTGGEFAKNADLFEYTKEPLQSQTAQKKIHLVEKGETLHRIAITYGCTVEDILKWNGLPATHQLLYGEKLLIQTTQP
ncbi:MAG TPA: transglycosylase SLT domain-containing protein [Bacteroidales bacterium]|nr:transglycosylase SLT domain-containing protein [Bacteroidales bacterium]